MMTVEYEKYDIGVMIGRFQVHDLHEAHCDIIETVMSRHKRTILFLGVASVIGSLENPLDYTSRKMMIQEQYPELVILALPDKREDEPWSKNVDSRIREVFPMGKVLLYGGRDSFIPHYMGNFDTTELEQKIFISGTEIRKQISEEIKASSLWRAGVIYNSANRYPISYQTVDIAAFSSDNTQILLAKKPGENLYRFIGGFVDPTDSSLEFAARREFMEEAGGAEVGNIVYVGSFRIDDWRYRGGRDKIMSALFRANYLFGTLTPSDDISELRWVDVETFSTKEFINTEIVSEHRPLAISLADYIRKESDRNLQMELLAAHGGN